jgi:hypothetical protein
MKYKIIILTLLVVITSCMEIEPPKPPRKVIVHKVVKEKRSEVETDYRHVYSILQDNFVLQPDVHQVYYLVYTDGTYQKVDLGKYSTTDKGDTITQERFESQ